MFKPLEVVGLREVDVEATRASLDRLVDAAPCVLRGLDCLVTKLSLPLREWLREQHPNMNPEGTSVTSSPPVTTL